MKKHAKRIIYDIIGLLLIIISPFLGSIPGPGGIAVFLAGLGLLAVHNDWAKKLLIKAKDTSENFLDFIFIDTPKIKLLHDVIGVLLLVIAIAVYLYIPSPFKYALPFMLGSLSIFWLLYNRKRYKIFKKP